jgi:EmrB/QacA subfamily drug resistance transporter
MRHFAHPGTSRPIASRGPRRTRDRLAREGRQYRVDVTDAARLQLRSRRGRIAVAATIVASGVAFLDGSIVNVALPHIDADLGGGFTAAQWIVSGYLLTLGSLVLVGGSLGDLLGKRRVFETGLVVFAISSVLCGLAPSVLVLIIARLLQGVGAALLVPTSLALLSALFTDADRGAAIGAWSGLSGVFTALGPFVGGALVDSSVAGWRWAFLINPPLVVLALVLSRRGIPDLPGMRTDAPLRGQVDVLGGVLITVGLALLVGPLIEIVRLGTALTLVIIGAGAVVLTGFVLLEARRERTLAPPPLLSLQLFKIRSFVVANIVTFVVYGALSVAGFMLSILLQVALDYSALQAGAATVPLTVILAVLSSRVGRLVPTVGPRILLTGGCLVIAVGFTLLSRIDERSSYLSGVLPGVIVFGLGLALVVAPVTTTALADVSGPHAGGASGVNNAVARIAGLAAIAALPLLGGLAGDSLTGSPGFVAGYGRTVLAAAALCLIGAAVSWWGFRPRGAPALAGAPT